MSATRRLNGVGTWLCTLESDDDEYVPVAVNGPLYSSALLIHPVQGWFVYLKIASKRSTGVFLEPRAWTQTSVNGTVGFSRWRGVEWNASTSLTVCERSIAGGRRLSRGGCDADVAIP